MKPVEIVLRRGGEEKRENDGVFKSNKDIFQTHMYISQCIPCTTIIC
jgi:hypothetical protein